MCGKVLILARLAARRASSEITPQLNDLVIRGYLLAIDEGSAVKRVAVGFGSGGSELTVAAESFQMTAQGPPRRVGRAFDSSQ